MRHRFVPSYFTRDMVRKLEQLNQGSITVREYYDALETTLLYSFIEENEEQFMDRFWRGLNRDIQDILMHEEYYSVNRMFCLACKAEQKIKRRVNQTRECKKTMNFSTSPPIVRAPCELELQGNINGTTSLPPHEIDVCHNDLHLPCVELVDNLVTPPKLEHCAAIDLNLLCEQTTEIDVGLSTPIADCNSSIDLSAPTENIVDKIEPCDMPIDYDLDHIN